MFHKNLWRVILMVLPALPLASTGSEIIAQESRAIRHEVRSPEAAKDLESLKAAIAVMMELDRQGHDDRTGWRSQANIHGRPRDGTTCGPRGPVMGRGCVHGNLFFLPWHRVYLHYFDRIIREHSGDKEFSLPYWDYAEDGTLPEAFRDKDSPLYVGPNGRGACWNDGTCRLLAADVSAEEAFTKDFFCTNIRDDGNCQYDVPEDSFGGAFSYDVRTGAGIGALETKPHTLVHNGMAGWMGMNSCAARDPIFWVHHANIDRLWQKWMDSHNKDIPQCNESWKQAWEGQTFTFYDEHGKEVHYSACELLEKAAQLKYRYEKAPVVLASTSGSLDFPALDSLAAVDNSAEATVELGSRRKDVQIDLPDRSRNRISLLAEQDNDLWLVLRHLRTEKPGAYYRVYLDLPEGATPIDEKCHYVGVAALFGHGHEVDFHIEVGKVLQRLYGSDLTGLRKVIVTFLRALPGGASEPDPKDETVYMSFAELALVKY